MHETLLKLEVEGLVEVISRRGVGVLPLSSVDMREMLNCIQDGDGARRAFRNHRERTAEELITILDDFKLTDL